jgi:hypothetical protein
LKETLGSENVAFPIFAKRARLDDARDVHDRVAAEEASLEIRRGREVAGDGRHTGVEKR